MDFVAYHDRTSADHQAHFNDLFPKGYRMTSLSVYGARGDEHYAAVWVKRSGPDWSAVHSVDFAGYQAAFDNAVAAGFKPVLLAATGPANDPVFAGTFEQRAGPVPLTRHGLFRGLQTDPATIDYWMAQARMNGWMPASIAIYGSAPDLRYAAIWVDNPQGICWTTDGLADTASGHQSRFDAIVPAWARPLEVAVSPDDRYASIPAAGTPTSLPVDGRMTDRYMVTLPASAPPQPPLYNNWGYFLLGHVVMAKTGQPNLPAALGKLLLQPLAITGIRSARTRIESQPGDEARYHPTQFYTGPSMVDPDRRLRVSGYGGYWNLERDDGGGGLSGSVVDVARLLAMLDVRRHNPVLHPAAIANLFNLAAAGGGHGFDSAWVINATNGIYYGQKGGDIPESNQNCVRYRTDDYSMVVCWNRSDIGEGAGGDTWWYPDFPAVLSIARSSSWRRGDLFPEFGMPTLLSRRKWWRPWRPRTP